MTAKSAIRAPEAGRRLGVRTAEIYRLVDADELTLIKDEKGLARITTASLDAYLARH